MKKVVVVGAGYTGLVSALRFAQKGYEVTVLEKSNIVGGLASDFLVEGGSLERAYHHLFKTDTSIIDLSSELGIGDKLRWHDSSVALYYEGKLYPFKGAVDLMRFKPLHFINRVRAGLVVLYLQKTRNWEKLQTTSAYSWMKRYAGHQITEVIWEPLLKGKFNTYYDKVAMSWLWARIHIRAQSRESGGEKLGYFEGGFQTFTNALTKSLKSYGVKIKTNVSIESIHSLQNGKIKVSYADSRTEMYDMCLSTTPSHIFAKLIQNNKKVGRAYIKQLESIDYLGARLLIFSSSQKLSPYYWHNINDVNLPFLVFINHTQLVSKKNFRNKYVYYIATYIPHEDTLFTCGENELENVWFKSLTHVFPSFDMKLIGEKYHFRFANAQHIVDTHYVKKVPAHKTPLKNIYLANFSQIYPEDRGTNYAVRDGEKVAALMVEEDENSI